MTSGLVGVSHGWKHNLIVKGAGMIFLAILIGSGAGFIIPNSYAHNWVIRSCDYSSSGFEFCYDGNARKNGAPVSALVHLTDSGTSVVQINGDQPTQVTYKYRLHGDKVTINAKSLRGDIVSLSLTIRGEKLPSATQLDPLCTDAEAQQWAYNNFEVNEGRSSVSYRSDAIQGRFTFEGTSLGCDAYLNLP